VKSQLWAVGEEACCPFKHHTRASLRQLLQPSCEFVMSRMCALLDAGDYCAACHVYLLDRCLTIESCSDVSNTVGKSSLVCEVVTDAEHVGNDDMQVAETLESGYDSAQSVRENCTESDCVSSLNHSTELTDTDSRLASKSTNIDNPTFSVGSFYAHRQCSRVPLKLDVDQGICNVHKQHIVESDCDTVAIKLHSPVDFCTSFSRLVTGLQSHAVS